MLQPGNGYHHEEWYVPAEYVAKGSCYWSQSYMDPYSYQPMVTCTVAQWEQGQFNGVATVDLRLEGLEAFADDWRQKTGGYVFIVDRNNRFITYPDAAKVKRIGKDDKGGRTEEFITAAEFAAAEPLFKPLADALQLITTSTVPAIFSASGNDLNNPNPGSAVDMRAEALYPNSTPVPDLFFDWYIVPLGGTGTLITSRDGRTCRFVNGVSTGIANVTTEGNSVVAVHGSYRGQGQPPQNYVLGGVNPYINISPVYQLGP